MLTFVVDKRSLLIVKDFNRDESPMVCKPAKEIIANIGDTVYVGDTVSIDTIIRPIFNFKASN